MTGAVAWAEVEDRVVEEDGMVTQADLENHWRSVGKLEVTVSCTGRRSIGSSPTATTDDDGKRNVESALLTDLRSGH